MSKVLPRWSRVAELLGAPAGPLPLRIFCPLCDKPALTVFQDTRAGRVWHHCLACGSCGDQLDLIAGHWGVNRAIAGVRLQGEPPPPPRTRAEDRALAFWQEIRARPQKAAIKDPAVHREVYQAVQSIPVDYWRDCGSRIATAALRREVRSCCPSEVHKADCIAFPYWRVPGVICGFGILKAGGEAPEYLPVSGSAHEAGLAGLPAAFEFDKIFGGKVLAVQDPAVMLLLQFKHLRTQKTPLPMVSWRWDALRQTQRAWHVLMGKNPVLWEVRLTPQGLAQAMDLDADLVIAGPEREPYSRLPAYLRIRPPFELFKRVLRRAVPWRTAAAAWVEGSSDGDVCEILAGLHACGRDPRRLIDAMGSRTADRLFELGARSTGGQIAKLTESLTVWEQLDGWYSTKRDGRVDRLMLDARLRIGQYRIRKERPVYTLRIYRHDQEIEIEVDVFMEDKEIVSRIKGAVLKAGQPPLRMEPRFSKTFLRAAFAFSGPTRSLAVKEK